MGPPQRLIEMRDAGDLGRKTGRGFYEYDTPA
jgi:3-hydroxyacyl-CoA dehydrogenase